MATETPTIRMCTLCGNPRQARTVNTAAAGLVEVAVCNICDKRKCEKCNHYEQDTHIRSCSNCGNRF